MREPTRKQLEVLRAIQKLTEENSLPPTMREIQAEVGLANVSTASFHLSRLKEKGYITYEPKKSRTVRILKSPDE